MEANPPGLVAMWRMMVNRPRLPPLPDVVDVAGPPALLLPRLQPPEENVPDFVRIGRTLRGIADDFERDRRQEAHVFVNPFFRMDRIGWHLALNLIRLYLF